MARKSPIKSTKKPIKVLIAIGNVPTYSEGLQLLLDETADFKVVAIANDGSEAISKSKLLTPDILILGTRLPGINAAQVTKRLKSSLFPGRIILLTPRPDEHTLIESIREGADGYLSTSTSTEQLVNVLKVLNHGTVVFDSRLGADLLRQLFYGAQNMTQHDSQLELNSHQLEILQLISNGMTSREIGKQLDMSERTIQAQLHNIFIRTGTVSRTGAVAQALERGWI
ncbi:MAG: response regulator transcription factor [Chloroflexi bacterium]|nr:response regulator transcription factor [Chloroflexota bacterium]